MYELPAHDENIVTRERDIFNMPAASVTDAEFDAVIVVVCHDILATRHDLRVAVCLSLLRRRREIIHDSWVNDDDSPDDITALDLAHRAVTAATVGVPSHARPSAHAGAAAAAAAAVAAVGRRVYQMVQ